MTPLILLDDLSEFLRKTVKEFRLPAKKNIEVVPKVYEGCLPLDDEGQEESACPYVIARIIKVNDTEKDSTAKILILIGTRATDDGFWRDCLNVTERIRQNLLLNRIIGKRFQLKLPLEIDFPEGEMPYPEAVGIITTTWIIPQVKQQMEVGVYGENIPGGR